MESYNELFLQSYFMESYLSSLSKSIIKITNYFKSNSIEFMFIGGIARNLYGEYRTTDDFDILVDIKDKKKVLDIPIGYAKDISQGRGRVFLWHDPKSKLEVLYSNEISGDGQKGLKFDNPSKLSNDINGIPVIKLEAFIEYKLSSGIYGKRLKDLADVQDFIQLKKLPLDFSRNFRQDLKIKYEEIWNNTNIN